MQLQQLFSFGGLVHSAEHDFSTAAHDVEPIAKYAAGKAWMGTKACYANASCKASVEKVGIAATEAAFAQQLQELNWFSGAEHWVSGAAKTVEHTFSSGFDKFKSDCDKAAKASGPYFKIAGKDMEWAAGETWKGAQWCFKTPPCKAAAEKYGTEAVEKGMSSAALQ